MVSIVTPSVISGLSAGQPYKAEIPAKQNGNRRFIYVYPVGSGKLQLIGAPPTIPSRYSVVWFEATSKMIASVQHGRNNCSYYEVIYVEGLDALEDAISRVADGPVTLVKSVAEKIVVRPEPLNWRIEYNGKLMGSAGSLGDAASFASAAAQYSYEYHGIVPLIFVVENGREENSPWEPDHDFLDDMDD